MCGSFREDHNAKTVLQPLLHGLAGFLPAFFAFAVDPNGSQQRRTPANDGPRFAFNSSYEYHGRLGRNHHGIDVAAVVAHENGWFLGQFPLHEYPDAHERVHAVDEFNEDAMNAMAIGTVNDVHDSQLEGIGQAQKQEPRNAVTGTEEARNHSCEDRRKRWTNSDWCTKGTFLNFLDGSASRWI